MQNNLLLLGVFLLSPWEGTTPSTLSNSTHVGILFDLTDERKISSLSEMNKLFLQMGHGTVLMTSVTDRSLNLDSLIVRDPIPSFWMRSENVEKIKTEKFLKDAGEAYRAFANAPHGCPKTYFFGAMTRTLKWLGSFTSAQKKHAIIFSDMFENSDIAPFYEYRNAPGKLLEDYNDIIHSLESAYGIKELDLRGVTITVVYLPEKENDALFRACILFWQRYWSERSAKVEFVTRLSGSRFLFDSSQ